MPAQTVTRLVSLRQPAGMRAAIEAIFWETVASPPPAPERAAFRDLWFGQYLRDDPQLVFVATDCEGQAGGYLVGCHENPARSPRFASLPFYLTFAAACARYPAHLHINLTASWRGRGVGGRLIDAFDGTVRDASLPGFHVVTAADARNVAFYTREGFREIDRATNASGRAVVFLGRDTV